jgi:NDP-sugar pyrophosphorylase family protein
MSEVSLPHNSGPNPVQFALGDRTGELEVRAPDGSPFARLTLPKERRIQVEIVQGAGGSSVVLTHPGIVRYLCFPGSAASAGGCVVTVHGTTRARPLRNTGATKRRRELRRQTATHQAAITAGGLATRFAPIAGPLTGVSKPGVEIGRGVSLIRQIVERLAEAGISEVFINTHYAPEHLRSGLEESSANLHFHHEEKPTGTAGPLRKALTCQAFPKFDPSKPLLVVQGDTLTDVPFDDVLLAHQASTSIAATIAVQQVEDADVSRFGIVVPESSAELGAASRVLRFLEKPTSSECGSHRLASTGIYVLGTPSYPLVLQAHDQIVRREPHVQRGEAEPPLDFARHVFPLALRANGINAVEVSGYWNDIGNPEQYFCAVRDIRDARVRLCSGGSPIDCDPSGVVYWYDGRSRASQAGDHLEGNVIVTPLGT